MLLTDAHMHCTADMLTAQCSGLVGILILFFSCKCKSTLNKLWFILILDLSQVILKLLSAKLPSHVVCADIELRALFPKKAKANKLGKAKALGCNYLN